MTMDEEESPRRPIEQPGDLDRWSVEELEAYIARLEAEIERARAAIEAKQSVRGAAEALFKQR